jgi:two-component system, chemotaxis family, CheB/CheR fusion protein
MIDQPPQLNSFGLDTREDIIVNAIEIFGTIKQSLIVLDKELKVVLANASFYETYKVTRAAAEGRKIFEIGSGQWNIPALRALLDEIIPAGKAVDDYEVAHNFPHIGPKVMLLNAREIIRQDNRQRVILLAIEDITLHKQIEQEIRDAEAKITSILHGLVGSSERISGGTAPQRAKMEPDSADLFEERNG